MCLCVGNPSVAGGFPAQRVSNTESLSIWCHDFPAIRCRLRRGGVCPTTVTVLRCGWWLGKLRGQTLKQVEACRYTRQANKNMAFCYFRHYVWKLLLTHWGRYYIYRHFADDSFKCIILNINVLISLEISLKFFPKVRISNIQALV